MTRRDEGTLRERSPGRWEISVHVAAGKRRWRVVHGNRKTANAALRALIAEVAAERGRDVLPGERTVGDAVEAWLTATAPEKAPRTVVEQRRVARLHVIPQLGRVRLDQLRRPRIREWHRELRDTAGLSTQSVRHAHNVLNAAFKWAVEEEWVDAVATANVPPPAVHRAQVDLPPVDMLVAYLAAADEWEDGRIGVLVRVVATTGCRLGEAVGLRWGDIDWTGSALTIVRAATKVSGQRPSVKETKTPRSRRRVGVDDATLASMARLEGCNQSLGFATTHDCYLFPWWKSAGARPDDPKAWSQRWRSALRAAGLPAMRLHDWRHLAASLLLDAGVPLSEVSARLGHAKTSTTTDLYGHLVRDRTAEQAAILSAVYRQEPSPR